MVLKGAVAPFNVGMGQVQNGRLYLRYGSNLVKTTAKSDKMLTEEKPLLFYCKKNAPRVPLAHTKAEKNKHENFDFVLLLSSSSFCTHITQEL